MYFHGHNIFKYLFDMIITNKEGHIIILYYLLLLLLFIHLNFVIRNIKQIFSHKILQGIVYFTIIIAICFDRTKIYIETVGGR